VAEEWGRWVGEVRDHAREDPVSTWNGHFMSQVRE
jgi:hypothetical protein